jgi:hypothetical protein
MGRPRHGPYSPIISVGYRGSTLTAAEGFLGKTAVVLRLRWVEV